MKKYEKIQLERPPAQKKKISCLISGAGFFLFYGTYNTRKKPSSNKIDLETLFFQPFLVCTCKKNGENIPINVSWFVYYIAF